MLSSSSSSISTSLERLRTGLVDPPVEIIWSSHPSWPLSPNNTDEIRISVLDSSFNPPTLAHLALANATAPTPSTSNLPSQANPQLLLLSVRNADKQLKSSDASYTQRVQMMIELAKDIHDHNTHRNPEAKANDTHPGIAVAIIDEPTFVRKSKLLRSFFSERLHARHSSSSPSSSSPSPPLPHPRIRLTFILGYDTLERLFAPRYYNSSPEHMYSALRAFFADNTIDDGDGDGSLVICARRSPSSYPHPSLPPDETSSTSLTKTISTFLTSSNLPSSSVSIIDIGQDVWSISSSEVRDSVKSGRESDWTNSVTDRVKRYIAEHGLYK